MSFSILILLILIVIIGLCSFFLISLNESIISLDLLIIEIDLSLGYLILITYMLGLISAILLEGYFLFLQESKKMTDLRKQINESLQKFGNQIANSKIFDLASNNNSIHNIINTPFFNFDFSKQKINLEAYELLLTIPGQLNIKENLFKLLEGDFDNPTENKKVSHTIYRLSSSRAMRIFFLREKK